jgi:hypothetical protein
MIVTFVGDQAATTKIEEDLDLEILAARIEITTGPNKASLPWVKLARFGEQRSAHGSLRNNANVTAVTGVEGDYDGEAVTVDDALRYLQDVQLSAILYTSPSHTPDRPRWRVLCPCSTERPPGERDRLLDRLNGVLGGILATESWTLSQSYYFGSINQNSAHRVLVTEGRCIDQAHDLDAAAISRPQTVRSNGDDRGQHPASRVEDISDKRIRGLVATLLGKVGSAPDGQKHRILFDIGRTVGGYLHLIGWSEGEAVTHLVNALPASVKSWKGARKTAADAIACGLEYPLALEDRPFTQKKTTSRADRVPSGSPPPEEADEAEPEPQLEPEPEPEPELPPGQGKATQKRPRQPSTNLLALVTHIRNTPAWDGMLRFNLLTENYETCSPFPPNGDVPGTPRQLNDPHDILLATLYFQANGFPKTSKILAYDALMLVAHENAYHPVRDYLTALRWDQTPRVHNLFRHYFNAELPPEPQPDQSPEMQKVALERRDQLVAYLEHISTGFMVGAVARVMQPGIKHDHTPVVIDRNQGTQKSTAIRALCHDPAWFSDNLPPDVSDRDTKESLRGKWIIELSEIPHVRRDIVRLKAFLTTLVDRYRPAYGRASQDHPRQVAFIGTSNDLEFVDVGGNRRFWPFTSTGRIDVAAIERDRDQLWAEAADLYRRHIQWWLPPNIEEIARQQQEAFIEADLWDAIIAKWIAKRAQPTDPFTMENLFDKNDGITPYRETVATPKADEMRAARCLKKLGWRHSRCTYDGKRAWWWEKT